MGTNRSWSAVGSLHHLGDFEKNLILFAVESAYGARIAFGTSLSIGSMAL